MDYSTLIIITGNTAMQLGISYFTTTHLDLFIQNIWTWILFNLEPAFSSYTNSAQEVLGMCIYLYLHCIFDRNLKATLDL